MAGRDIFTEEEPTNEQLETVLDMYDCHEYMPFANRVFWLASVKEVMGHIPDFFDVDYDEIRGLVWLSQESGNKIQYDNWKMDQQSKMRTSQLKK